MDSVILIILVTLFGVLLCLLVVLFHKNIEKNSTKIRQLNKLNAWYHHNAINIHAGFCLEKINCSSKAQFDKPHEKEVNQIIYRKVETLDHQFERYRNNNQVTDSYFTTYRSITSLPSKRTSSIIGKYTAYYEKKYVERNSIAQYGDIDRFVFVYFSYTSPQGRNSYGEKFFITPNTVSYIKSEKLKEQQNVEYSFLKSQNKLFGNKIYIFSDIHQPGLCIGQTTSENVEDRIKSEYKNMPVKPWVLHHQTSAIKDDGSYFTDKEFHRYLMERGYHNYSDHKGSSSEWFEIPLKDAIAELDWFKRL